MKKNGRNASARAAVGRRRSPCPVACGLDVIGDRWTLLIIRDMFLGRSRFKEFVASPENIPTNILSERLVRLQASGIICRIPSADGSKHPAYGLTAKGKALIPFLRELRKWGLKWIEGTDEKLQKTS